MGAARRERFEVARLCADKLSGLAAELKDLSGVDRYFSSLTSENRILLGLDDFRRNHESEDRIKDRRKRGERACPQKVVDEPPARESRGRSGVVVTFHRLLG